MASPRTFLWALSLATGCSNVIAADALRIYNLAGSDDGSVAGETTWVSPVATHHLRFEWTPDDDFARTQHGCGWYREVLDDTLVGEGEYYVGGGAVTLYGQADGTEAQMPLGEGLSPGEWLDLDGLRWLSVGSDEEVPSLLDEAWDPTCR